MFTVQSTSSPDWRKAVAELGASTEMKAQLILESVGAEVVAYLKSRTEQERHWIVRFGELEQSYGYEVKPFRGGAMLILRAEAEHAIYLEARDGFFVLHGVTDGGGPVEQAIRDVISVIAPELTFVR